MGEEFEWFLGVDWGTAHHAVHLADAEGRQILEARIAHTREELERFLARLGEVTQGQLARVAVGIETPRGAVVDVLLERGAAVFAVNPKQLDRFRDRFSVAGAKDDPLDARVLGSAVRTDRARFRRVAPDEPLVIRIRELSRAQDVLVEERLALANRLRELIHRITPGWLTLVPAADEPWFWEVVAQAATVPLGRQIRRRRIERVLTAHRIRRVDADAVLAALATPPLVVAPGTVEAVVAHIALLLPRLRLVHEQHHACLRALDAALEEAVPPDGPAGGAGAEAAGGGAPAPHDVTILRSLPGVGPIVASGLLAEAAPLLAQRDYAGLRAYLGVAPVRRRTGKQRHGTVSMRYACSTRLRNIAFYWAKSSIACDTGARRYYDALRARGHGHARALRSVADRWLRILVAMLTTHTLYDPTRFQPA